MMYSSASRVRSRTPPNKMLKADEAQMVLRPQREKEQEKAESHMKMEDPAVAAVQMEWPFEGSWWKSSRGEWYQFQFGVWWKQVATVRWERYRTGARLKGLLYKLENGRIGAGASD